MKRHLFYPITILAVMSLTGCAQMKHDYCSPNQRQLALFEQLQLQKSAVKQCEKAPYLVSNLKEQGGMLMTPGGVVCPLGGLSS